ncbi:MAG: hypothetical protein RLZZ480_821 [Candidatus Parcubacteria bacterium]|jgi:hypothetical protein
MNIYLDIDGTMIHEDLTVNSGKPAAGLEEFLIALRPHTTYWLTTHCRDGNPARAREIMKRVLPDALHPDIDRILPTTWDMNKTEGIDWSQDFIWFDNDVSEHERAAFPESGPNRHVIEVNLRENPDQLIEITADLLA